MFKSSLLVLTIILGLGVSGMATAQQATSTEPVANVSNVPSVDLKQKILIEETGSGISALIKAAKVMEISSMAGSAGTTPDLLKVKILGQDYKIRILANTNVVRHYWGKSPLDLSEFSVGDIINVLGTLDSTDFFLINAKTVRNVSIQQKHGVFSGTIKSITPPSSFILETARASSLLVNTDANTKIYQGKELKTFSDLQIGMSVLVRGIWNRTLTKIQALIVRIKPTAVISNP